MDGQNKSVITFTSYAGDGTPRQITIENGTTAEQFLRQMGVDPNRTGVRFTTPDGKTVNLNGAALQTILPAGADVRVSPKNVAGAQ